MKHIYLVGFMGAGKSTVGEMISTQLDLPFVDLDDRIERMDKHTVAEIFAERGEDSFRILETGALAALAAEPPSVVACGGGIVIRDANRAMLKQTGRVIYLKVSTAEALARVGDSDTRPLLSGASGATAVALLTAREVLYEAVSDAAVDTSGRHVEQVASDVLAIVEREGWQ